MLAVSMMVGAGNPYKKYTQNLPFDMPEVSAPQIPEHEVSLSDYGADGSGQSLCTDAFARAIDALSAIGGAAWYMDDRAHCIEVEY